jgi:hypothetical protein
MNENLRSQDNPTMNTDSTRFRNAARVSPLSGRHIPTKYTSPLDTQHFLTPEEFHDQFIRNKPGNRYTDKHDVLEIPLRTNMAASKSSQSPVTPVTATSTTATQRSETQTSVGSSTYHHNDEQAPTGWYYPTLITYFMIANFISLGFGRSDSRKRSKAFADDGSDEYNHKPPKRVRRSLSWKSWYSFFFEVDLITGLTSRNR